MSTPWPVEVRAIGHASGGSCLWTLDGQQHVTVVVKASFGIGLDGVLGIVDAEPVSDKERHYDDHPLRSLTQIRETVPRLDYADVVVSAHAFARDGANRGRARLVIARETTIVLDKAIEVLGDRATSKDTPAPFETVPLCYEFALGGIGFADNPIGTGYGAGTETPPNLLDPEQPDRVCACFAPIPASWAARKQKLRGESWRMLQKSDAVIPAGIDWSFFQCAPTDQRLSHLSGNEIIVLEGMHERRDRVRFQLPSALGRVRLSGPGELPEEIPARLDLLHVDVLRGCVSMVWRACMRLPVDVDAGQICAVVGIEQPGNPIDWPDHVLSDGFGDPEEWEETLEDEKKRGPAPSEGGASVGSGSAPTGAALPFSLAAPHRPLPAGEGLFQEAERLRGRTQVGSPSITDDAALVAAQRAREIAEDE